MRVAQHSIGSICALYVDLIDCPVKYCKFVCSIVVTPYWLIWYDKKKQYGWYGMEWDAYKGMNKKVYMKKEKKEEYIHSKSGDGSKTLIVWFVFPCFYINER